MPKEISNPYKRYVTAHEFLDYCKANNVYSSKFDLEAYEKHGLLYPIFRTKYPEDYIQAKYNSPTGDIELKSNWEEFLIFENHINIYKSSVVDHILQNGHIFIEEYNKGNKYLFYPENEKFIPWNETKVEFLDQNNHEIKLDTIKNYYAYWQIFVLVELNQKNILKENFVSGSKRGLRNLSKENIPSQINKFAKYLESISDYKYFDYLIWNESIIKSKNFTLSESKYNIYLKRVKKSATSIFSKYSYIYWIQILRKLCSVHYDYLQSEKIKLSNEVKRLITSLINLILDSTDFDFFKICDDHDGEFKNSRFITVVDGINLYPGYLKEIFPEIKNTVYFSVFISYGTPDQKFAEKLNNDLTKHNVETFLFTENALPGEKLHRVMRKGINKYDRVILICSESSLNRSGVINEIEETLQREAREGGNSILIPVTLDDYIFSNWAPSKPDIAQSIRDRVVVDFRKAIKNKQKYYSVLKKLLNALEKQ
jgi:hypothetical protein